MFDRILEVARDPRGMLYNTINPQSGKPTSTRICDTWGYNYNGIYTVYLIDGTEAYRQAVRKALGNLKEHVIDHNWGSAGTYGEIKVVAEDPQGLVGFAAFTLLIEDRNSPPYLSPMGTRACTPGELSELPLTANDPDGDVVTFTIVDQDQSGWVTLLDVDPNDSKALLRCQPPAGTISETTVVVTASDGRLSVSEEVRLLAGVACQPPALAEIGRQYMFAGERRVLTLSATDDASTEELTFSLSGNPSWVSLRIDGPGQASLVLDVPSGLSAGDYFGGTVKVADRCPFGALSDTRSFQIDVGGVQENQAPVITNLPATQSVHWGQAGTYDANATDSDVPANTLSWSLSGNSCTFTPSVNGTSGLVSWTCGGIETCNVDVEVKDNGEPSKSDKEQLTIACANRAPLFQGAPADTALEGTAYTYQAVCTDGDQDTLVLNKGPSDTCAGSLSITGNGMGTYSFTPGENLGGQTCVVELTCGDTQSTVTVNETVAVAEENTAPSLTNLPATESGPWGRTDSFTATATDADLPANTLTFSLASTTCAFTPAVNASTGEVTWTCGPPGNCDINVMVKDNGVPEKSDTLTLAIQCTNQSPTFSTAAATSVLENNPYLYEVGCTDGDGDSLNLARGGRRYLPGCAGGPGRRLGRLQLHPR